MGACYSVALNLTIADEKACVETLCNKIKNDSEKVNYNLELAEKLGLSTDNLADLICIFFGGCMPSSRPHLLMIYPVLSLNLEKSIQINIKIRLIVLSITQKKSG